MKQGTTRNLVVFEAPIKLTEKTKAIAEQEMCSISAICRRALNQFISATEAERQSKEYASY